MAKKAFLRAREPARQHGGKTSRSMACRSFPRPLLCGTHSSSKLQTNSTEDDPHARRLQYFKHDFIRDENTLKTRLQWYKVKVLSRCEASAPLRGVGDLLQLQSVGIRAAIFSSRAPNWHRAKGLLCCSIARRAWRLWFGTDIRYQRGNNAVQM